LPAFAYPDEQGQIVARYAKLYEKYVAFGKVIEFGLK